MMYCSSLLNVYTIKPLYKSQPKAPENVTFMSSSPLYRLRLYALFIDMKNYTALYRQWFAKWRCPLRQVWHKCRHMDWSWWSLIYYLFMFADKWYRVILRVYKSRFTWWCDVLCDINFTMLFLQINGIGRSYVFTGLDIHDGVTYYVTLISQCCFYR